MSKHLLLASAGTYPQVGYNGAHTYQVALSIGLQFSPTLSNTQNHNGMFAHARYLASTLPLLPLPSLLVPTLSLLVLLRRYILACLYFSIIAFCLG